MARSRWTLIFLWTFFWKRAIKSPSPSWNQPLPPHMVLWKKKEKKKTRSSLASGFALTRKMRAGGLNANGEASDVPYHCNKPQIPYSWGEFWGDFAHHCVFATRKNNRRYRGWRGEGGGGCGCGLRLYTLNKIVFFKEAGCGRRGILWFARGQGSVRVVLKRQPPPVTHTFSVSQHLVQCL